MAVDDQTNGRPPGALGKKLVEANYGERAAAASADSRLMTQEMFLRNYGVFSPDLITVQDRKRMRQDFTVKMALWYSKAPIVRADYAFECEDPAIQAGMTEIWEAMHQPWMKTALLMYDYGFKGAVKQFEKGKIDAMFENPDTGEQEPVWNDPDIVPVVLGTPIGLPPESTRVKIDRGHFKGIITPLAQLNEQNRDPDDPIPADWCMWYVNEFEEEDRNWYGRARIDPAYELWYAYWFIFHMRNRHAEMDADPALQIWYPTGSNGLDRSRDATGEKKSNRSLALEMGTKLRGGATIAWPSDVHMSDDGKLTTQRLWEAGFLTGGENLPAFTELLGDMEVGKLRACLVPEQSLIEAQKGTGARNVAKVQADLFTQSLEQTAVYLDYLHNRYLIRPVVEANWGRDAPRCVKKTTGFQEEDLTLATELIKVAFGLDPNALPIDFEELIKRVGLPTYSKKEQMERENAAAQVQQDQADAAAEAAAAAPPPPVVPGAAGPDAGALAASQDDRRTKPRKYERESINLSAVSGWARREGRRRQRNINALAERLQDVMEARYADVFEACAEAIADTDGELNLSLGDVVTSLVHRMYDWIESKVGGYRGPLEGEMASIYHTSGMAELNRLGLAAHSWDVGRDEVQEWARWRAGELIKTIDQTVVEDHVRPWLAGVLQQIGGEGAPDFVDRAQGLPVDAVALASQLTEKFANYPHWMAERVVRTEAMVGYNLSAADMWERVGVTEVQEYDGLGGRTGKTDEECLRRNGQTVSIEQFREDTKNEHPNGTLGAVPVTVDVQLRPIEPGVIVANASQSNSIYGVTDSGLILSEAEVGRALAGT